LSIREDTGAGGAAESVSTPFPASKSTSRTRRTEFGSARWIAVVACWIASSFGQPKMPAEISGKETICAPSSPATRSALVWQLYAS